MGLNEQGIAYIRNLASNEQGWISSETADLGIEYLTMMRNLGLLDPNIAPGPDGLLGFTWNSEEYHTNIEIIPDPLRLPSRHRIEYYQENLKTGKQISMEF